MYTSSFGVIYVGIILSKVFTKEKFKAPQLFILIKDWLSRNKEFFWHFSGFLTFCNSL